MFFLLEVIIKVLFYLTVYSLIGVLLLLFGFKIFQSLTREECTCKTDLSGKIILITGGNRGIGFETAKILAKRGATVVIASRNITMSKAAAETIIKETGNPNIEYKALDLSKLSSVKQFADDFNKSYDRLDVLINNAGLSERYQVLTEDGIDKTVQINHVGPTYLTNLLLDKLIASKPSRIIFVSSRAYLCHNFDPNDIVGQKRNNFWRNYANTKLCNLLMARALSRTLPEGVTANSLHPGVAKTEIYEAGPVWFQKLIYFIIDLCFNTAEECSQTTVHLASAPGLENVSGEYFDECNIAKTFGMVTDELADRVYKDTLRLIDDRVNNVDQKPKKNEKKRG